MEHDSRDERPRVDREPVAPTSDLRSDVSNAPSTLAEQFPIVMPGDAQTIAKDIARVGVEGLPADPKAGPGATALLLGGVFVAIVVVAIVVWIRTDWATGLLTLGIVCLGMLVSPPVWASLMRARDKKEVLEETDHRPSSPRHG